MQSPVNWALLGLIIERPSYAYELARRFERTYEGVLSLSSVSHVYTAIAALKERSLIEEVPGTRSGRQPKPHYRASEQGIADYREWLVDQVGEDRRRQRLFVVQLAALTRDPVAALDVVERYEQACLAEARNIPIPSTDSETAPAGAVLRARLVAEENRHAVGAKLAWAEYARRELKALVNARAPQR
jgi:DNA-binding PadR family transcriptional regulator